MSAHNAATSLLAPDLHALHAQLDHLEHLLDTHDTTTPALLLGEVLREVELEVEALSDRFTPVATTFFRTDP